MKRMSTTGLLWLMIPGAPAPATGRQNKLDLATGKSFNMILSSELTGTVSGNEEIYEQRESGIEAGIDK